MSYSLFGFPELEAKVDKRADVPKLRATELDKEKSIAAEGLTLLQKENIAGAFIGEFTPGRKNCMRSPRWRSLRVRGLHRLCNMSVLYHVLYT